MCPTGLEFLVPKTGFFCKVCNRFYSGGKEVKLSHCKSLNHYENLQVGRTSALCEYTVNMFLILKTLVSK